MMENSIVMISKVYKYNLSPKNYDVKRTIQQENESKIRHVQ